MTDLFKCKKSGLTCCAPKSRILEIQGIMMRNDTYPNYNPHQIPPYQPNVNYPPYQAPQIVPNNYPQYQPIQPQASLPNNYQLPPNAYVQQPQQLPQPAIVGSNYVAGHGNVVVHPQPPPPQPQPQPVYPQNIYPQNMVGSVQNVPNINLAPAYSTPGMFPMHKS